MKANLIDHSDLFIFSSFVWVFTNIWLFASIIGETLRLVFFTFEYKMFGNLSWDHRKKLLPNRLKLFRKRRQIKEDIAVLWVGKIVSLKIDIHILKFYWCLINKDNARIWVCCCSGVRIRGQCSSLGVAGILMCVMCNDQKCAE